MILPVLQRMSVSNFPGQESWIGRLIQPLNLLFQTLQQGFSNGITISDNMDMQQTAITVVNGSATTTASNPYAYKPQSPLIVGLTLKHTPFGVIAVNATDNSAAGTATGPVFVQWIGGSSSIQITNITGLLPNKSYTINLLIF